MKLAMAITVFAATQNLGLAGVDGWKASWNGKQARL